MKLDDRIINPLEIYSPVNAMLAQIYIGQNGIFSNDSQDFENLKNAELRVLTDLELREGYTKRFCGDGFWYEYFLPLANVEPKKEKQYRPYTIEEFCNEGFEIVVFRNKNDESIEYHVRYNGYIKYDNGDVYLIIFGRKTYPLNELFDNFEYLDDDGEWKPFGVE